MMLVINEAAERTNGYETLIAERRRGVRIRQSRPVKVLEPRCGRYFAGRTHDISPTGLRIELPASAPLRTGETLSVHVGLTHSGERLVHRRQMIPAKVIWIQRDRSGARGLTAGVEFLASIAVQLDAA